MNTNETTKKPCHEVKHYSDDRYDHEDRIRRIKQESEYASSSNSQTQEAIILHCGAELQLREKGLGTTKIGRALPKT